MLRVSQGAFQRYFNKERPWDLWKKEELKMTEMKFRDAELQESSPSLIVIQVLPAPAKHTLSEPR
jgi:hypothetical protein